MWSRAVQSFFLLAALFLPLGVASLPNTRILLKGIWGEIRRPANLGHKAARVGSEIPSSTAG